MLMTFDAIPARNSVVSPRNVPVSTQVAAGTPFRRKTSRLMNGGDGARQPRATH
jgi:hypothetical protein